MPSELYRARSSNEATIIIIQFHPSLARPPVTFVASPLYNVASTHYSRHNGAELKKAKTSTIIIFHRKRFDALHRRMYYVCMYEQRTRRMMAWQADRTKQQAEKCRGRTIVQKPRMEKDEKWTNERPTAARTNRGVLRVLFAEKGNA